MLHPLLTTILGLVLFIFCARNVMSFMLQRSSWLIVQADCVPIAEVKRLRTDNGTEFTNKDFKSLTLKHRIKHEKSAPYSLHQNGTVERSWRSLFDMARCLLIESQLPKELWTYAVRAAAYTRNRCFCPRTAWQNTIRKFGRQETRPVSHVCIWFNMLCFRTG